MLWVQKRPRYTLHILANEEPTGLTTQLDIICFSSSENKIKAVKCSCWRKGLLVHLPSSMDKQTAYFVVCILDTDICNGEL